MEETPFSRLQKLLDQAATALWEEDWEEAARLYRQAIELSPANVLALTSLGYALMRSGDLQEASGIFGQAAELAPEDPLAWERLGSIAAGEGDIRRAKENWGRAAELALEAEQTDRAVRDLQEALRLEPDDRESHKRLATLYKDMKRPNLAVQELLICAALAQAAGDASEAGGAVEDALRLQPQNPEVLRALEGLRSGRPLPYAGSAAQVVPSQTPARVDAPGDTPPGAPGTAQTIVEEAGAKAVAALAQWAFEQTQGPARRSAGETRGQARTTNMKLVQALNQGLLAQRRGDEHNARRLFGEALRCTSSQELPALAFSLGMLSWREEPARARELLDGVAKQAGYRLAAQVLLGQIAEEKREWQQAASAYSEALLELERQLLPKEAWPRVEASYRQARSRLQAAQGEALAERVVRRVGPALKSPDGRASLERLHAERESAGVTAELSLLELLVEPELQDALRGLKTAREHEERGETAAALEDVLLALGKAPHLLPLHTELAELSLAQELPRCAADTLWLTTRAYLLRDEPEGARRALQRLVVIDPLNTAARQTLIGLCSRQGAPEIALEQTLQLMRVEGQLADYDAADRVAQQALEMAGGLENSREWSVRVLEQLKDLQVQRLDWEGALASVGKLIELDPENVGCKEERLRFELLLGREGEAWDALRGDLAAAAQAGELGEWRRFLRGLLGELGENPLIRGGLAEAQRLDGQAGDAGGGPYPSGRNLPARDQDHARETMVRGTAKKDGF